MLRDGRLGVNAPTLYPNQEAQGVGRSRCWAKSCGDVVLGPRRSRNIWLDRFGPEPCRAGSMQGRTVQTGPFLATGALHPGHPLPHLRPRWSRDSTQDLEGPVRFEMSSCLAGFGGGQDPSSCYGRMFLQQYSAEFRPKMLA